MWLAPFKYQDLDNQININLNHSHKITMIRLWNYNKSRIHTQRGAKYISIQMDDHLVFKGEIRKSTGNTQSIEDLFEIIMFSN